MIKKTRRGEFWKKIPKEQRSIIMAYIAKKRWDKMSDKQKSSYGKMMARAKKAKLSTGKSIAKK